MNFKNKMGLLLVVISAAFLMTGCDLFATGEYKEGTYFGYNEKTGTTAALYIDSKGMIKSIVVDKFQTKDCYTEKNDEDEHIAICTPTSKQILGLDDSESATLPWYKQAELISEKVIKEQGLDWLEFRYKTTFGDIVETKPEGQSEEDMIYTDSIAEVDMVVEDIYNAISSALEQSKK